MRIHQFLAVTVPVLSTGILDSPIDFVDDPFDTSNLLHELESDDAWDKDIDWDPSLAINVDDLMPSIEEAGKDGQDKDIDPEGPCKEDLEKHPECNHGRDRAVCLWMNAVDAARWGSRYSSGSSSWVKPLSSECKSYLVEFLSDASSHPFDYFHDLRSECAQALTSLCNQTMESTALACLRSHFDDISQPNCRDEITQLNSWTSLNASWWSPTLWRDCSQERRGVCENSTSTGLSDFRDCLDDHRDELSDNCHKSLFQSDLQAAPSPFILRRDVSTKCSGEMKQYCSDVVRGDENQLFCLFRASKRHSDRFDPACSQALTDVVKLLESDYRMNVPIRKFCRRTINDYCHEEKLLNDKNPHESDEVLDCLKRVYLYSEHKERMKGRFDWMHYEETEACMHAVRQSVLIDSLDWEVDSTLHSSCFQDYHKLLQRIKVNDPTLRDHDSCQGETPHECLQSHFHDIGSPDCQKAVALHSQLSSLDQDFKPQLLSACALALDDLDCSPFEEAADHHIGKDGLVQCLYSKIATISDSHCRGAVRHDFELSERDYRLSYELSLICAKDRSDLCGSESPDRVLKCMIEKIDDIKDSECHKDVSRLAFVALTEGEDVLEKSVCANDVAKLCQDGSGAHGTVHSCLLSNLQELSGKCSESVLNLHKSSASIDAMEKLLNSACSQVLVSDSCRHLIQKGAETSLQDKADCIETAMYAGTNTVIPECETQLKGVQTLLAADYRTNPELQRDCKTDVSLLCRSELDKQTRSSAFSTGVIQCLVQERAKVRNANCKKQIVRQIYKMSDDVMYVPNMRAVCGDDIKRFCPAVQPGQGQLHQCLRQNLEVLSHDCQSQEFAIEQMEEISSITRKSCEIELAGICKQAQNLHCLWRNVDESQPACERAVKSEMKGKIGNIWLDPSLYTKCRSSVNELISSQTDPVKCPSYLVELPAPLNGLIPLPSNYTQAVAGEHVACLGNNRLKIAHRPCVDAIETLIRMEIKDPVLLRFGLRSSCKRELSVDGVCAESSPFETVEQWRCLQRNVREKTPNISSPCTESVKRMWRLSLIDVSFNPDISSNCDYELKEHCKMGSNRALVCLYHLFQSGQQEKYDSKLSDQCTEAIKRMPSPETVDLDSSWKRTKSDIESSPQQENRADDSPPIEETARLLKEAADTVVINSQATLSLSGPLAFVSLASLFVVVGAALYKIYRYKMNKGYMVIVDKH